MATAERISKVNRRANSLVVSATLLAVESHLHAVSEILRIRGNGYHKHERTALREQIAILRVTIRNIRNLNNQIRKEIGFR